MALILSPSCGTVPPCGIGPPPVTGFIPETFYLAPGAIRVTVGFPSVPGCVSRQPDRVLATVYGPQNQTLPSAVSLGAGGAVLGFDAGGPGWHHLSVTFEPNLGIGQGDLLAASDRRTNFVEIPEDCSAVWPLSSGAALCDDAIYRGVAPYATQLAQVRLVEGRAVWEVTTDGILQRREDTGSGDMVMTAVPLRVGPPDGGTAAGWSAAAATEDELFALAPGGIVQYGLVSDAGTQEIRQMARASLPDGGGGTPRSLLAYAPVGSVWVASSSFSPDEETTVCRMRPARGEPLGFQADAGCLRIRGKPVGVSEDGFWIWPEREGTLHFVLVDGTGAQSRASIAVPGNSTLTQAGVTEGPPQFLVYNARGMLIPRFDGREIVFDAFDPDRLAAFRGASADLVWLLSMANPPRTRVFRRAP